MIEQKTVLHFLKEHKTEIAERFHLTKLGVFGSVARNDVHEGSDVDILVEFAPNTENLWETKEHLRLYLASALDVKIDICREKYIKPVYRSAILREVLYV